MTPQRDWWSILRSAERRGLTVKAVCREQKVMPGYVGAACKRYGITLTH